MKLKWSVFIVAIVMMFTSFSFAAETAKGKTIRLETFSGSVEVSSGSGKNVIVSEKMRVFDGYSVKTFADGEAYLSLDDTKVIKLGKNTEIKIKKSWFSNKITVISGELFFNVEKPLESNESLNISTPTMSMGIRGTSGCVISDKSGSKTQIYTGGVIALSRGRRFYIRAGEQGTSDLSQATKLKSDGSEIPSMALREINNDDSLKNEINEKTELDVENFKEQEAMNYKQESEQRESEMEQVNSAKESAIKEKTENKKSSTGNSTVTGKSSGGSSKPKKETLTWEILTNWIEQNQYGRLDELVTFASGYSSSLNISGYNILVEKGRASEVEEMLLVENDTLAFISSLINRYEESEKPLEEFINEFNDLVDEVTARIEDIPEEEPGIEEIPGAEDDAAAIR